MDDLTIEMYSPEVDYDLTGFDCGEPALNAFLFDHLARQHAGRILRAYLLIRRGKRPEVLGFYTLSGSCFERAAFSSKTQQRKLPYANVPSVTLGRLAVDKRIQGQEWGATLVSHALQVVWRASQAVGIYGIFVDAMNEKAHAFWLNLGFIPLTGENANSLFYSTKSIEMLFSDSDKSPV